jgi:hypothetical protein
MVARHFDAPPPSLENIARRAKSVGGKPPVAPFIEAINAGENALNRFGRGDAAALAPAAEKLEKTPALSDQADALRGDLKTLVVHARDIAGDKTLGPREREQRTKQLDEDFDAWQKRFEQWVNDEAGDEFGIKLQKDETRQDEKK